MNPDSWQLLIGILALCDGAYLIYKLKTQKADSGIIAAILPRMYVGVWYIADALTHRATMEPGRTITFIGIVLLFGVANFTHLMEWRYRK